MKKNAFVLNPYVLLCGTLMFCISSVALSESPDTRPSALHNKYNETKIRELIKQMSLEEKIGQMIQAERESLAVEDVEKYCLGSILSGGGSIPRDKSPKGWTAMYDAFQKQALSTRMKIPLIYGIDAVHGHNTVAGATIFPHNIGLGATRDPGLVEKICRITALEVAATGLNWTFSPCIAVPRDIRWGRTYEGFGETPDLQRLFAPAAVRGYQAPGFRLIAATAKHFVGDGGTSFGTGSEGRMILDRGDTKITEEELRAIHLPGYREAISAGVLTIMASFNAWNGTRMHAQKYLLTDVLKKELSFNGLVVSDWQGIDHVVPGDYRASLKASINAGVDMVMEPRKWKQTIDLLIDLVKKNEIRMDRIEDAVARILRVKYAIGLFDHPYADWTHFDTIGCATHRAVAREAVRKSLVLLKNSDSTLPLKKKGKTYIVAGSHANDPGLQCGGWTLKWQGTIGNIPGATSIYDGIRRLAFGDSIIWVHDGKVVKNADAAIIVVGEQPYAEWEGDKNASDLILDLDSKKLISDYRAAGVKVITMLISGRPLIVRSEIQSSDACVAAWLPGSEGEGIADVLFGDYNFTGKLGFAWPATAEQIPIHKGDNQKPLFEYGFGLSY
jgi:beta-glucosidase